MATYDLHDSFSGRPGPDRGWGCSFGLAFDQDTGRGEIVAECSRMR